VALFDVSLSNPPETTTVCIPPQSSLSGSHSDFRVCLTVCVADVLSGWCPIAVDPENMNLHAICDMVVTYIGSSCDGHAIGGIFMD
jgi:hypothetical protein